MPVEVSAAPMTFAGKPAMQFIARDITERKRAAEAVRESQQIIEGILNAIPVRVFWKDTNLVYLGCNAVFARDAGYADPKEIIGKDDYQLAWQEQAELYRASDRQVIESGNSKLLIEEPQTTPAGKTLTLLTSKLPLRNSKGEISGLLGTYLDITERKRAEEALRESEERFAGAFEYAPIGVALVSPVGRWLKVNRALCELVGYSETELLTRTYQDITYPEDLADDLENTRRLVAGEIPSYQMEKRYLHQCGHLVTVLLDVSLVRDDHGQPRYFISQIQDITERKRMAAALAANEKRFRAITERSAEGVALINPDGTMLYHTPVSTRLLGLPPEVLSGRRMWEFLHPDEHDFIRQELAQILATPAESKTVVLRWRLPDGAWRWLEISATNLLAESDLQAIVVNYRDITGRKMAEATAAAFSKLSHDLSFAATSDAAARVISGTADTLLAWDAFSIHLCAAEPDTMVPLFDADIVEGKRTEGPPRPGHKASALQRSILESGAKLILRPQPTTLLPGATPFGDAARPSASLLFVPIRSQARTLGLLSAQSYTPNAYGEADLRTLQTLADLCGGALERIWMHEALRKSEAQLIQSQKLEIVGKLAGGIAHEFNSILTVIIGQSDLILGDLPPGHSLTGNMTSIRKAAERAATLTRQLLAYGRKTFLQPEALDLNQIMADLGGTLRHFMGAGVNVCLVPAAGLHSVKADPGQMEQVILNLAMNAADAMPNGGRFTLETANVTLDAESIGRYPELKPGGYVMLAITDTGAGMTEAVKARAFEPFFTTKGVGQGTGLGLSTCYGILKQSGGHISVYSELGRGTTFKIYLPQAEPQARLPRPRLDSPDLPRGTETILLVEDDPALREMAATLLQRLGYTVLTAANGVEALSLHHQRRTERIELLFTDVVMPDMNGRELADRVRALYPQTRILFTSAYTEQAIIHQGVFRPGESLLQKPFTPAALAHKLREALDQPGPPPPDAAQKTFDFPAPLAGVAPPGNGL